LPRGTISVKPNQARRANSACAAARNALEEWDA